MDKESYEPQPPRPCSTPHSAPIAWLEPTPGPATNPAPASEPEPELTEDALAQFVALARRNPDLLADAISSASPDDLRGDGWTPFSRRLFLQVLAETGKITTACEWTGLTRQSAYALRARDALFAAGWDAACELARAPLADALYEKAIDGVTDTIVKDGEVVAERHRFDSRLSIAVLHRLDKRCDRAAELGSRHLEAVRHWDQWLTLVGEGKDEAAALLLQSRAPESLPHCQNCQLTESENPTDDEQKGLDLSDRCWRDAIDDDIWMTDFPPPAGFAGYESRPYDEIGDDEPYRRACTPEEVAVLEASEAADRAAERAGDEELRDQWFELLRTESSEAERR
jgi:hypothetical protein